MLANIKNVRIRNIQEEILTLKEDLDKDEKLRQKIHEQLHDTQQQQQQPSSKFSSSSSPWWVTSYVKYSNLGEELEVQNRIQSTKQKIQRLSQRLNGGVDHDTYNSSSSSVSNHHHDQNNDDTTTTITKKNHQLCSLLNHHHCRDAERRVANMSLKGKLKCMKSFRIEHGNRCFEKGQYDVALAWYEKSLNYSIYCFPSSNAEKQLLDNEVLLCLVNSAACHLEKKDYQKCVECCTEALQTEAGANNMKALYRRAKAYRLMHDFEKALHDLSRAESLGTSSNTSYLEKEREDLETAIRLYNDSSKNLAKKMFAIS